LRPGDGGGIVKGMKKPATIEPQLAEQLRIASEGVMTPEARERQLLSFAFGNVKLENDRVTKPQMATALRQSRAK
jgi:hypothetical protein